MTRRLMSSAFLGLTLFATMPLAAAQCLTGGDASYCDNPLTGKVAQASLVGGTLLPGGGFRVDDKGDHVTLDLGAQASSGSVRFTITNVSPANLNQDTHLVLLATDTKELKNPAPTRVLELKIWGDAADPAAQTTTLIGAGDGVSEGQKSAGKLSWNAATTYTIDVSWNNATQRLTFARNGTQLVDYKTGDVIPGTNNPPVELRYRYIHFAMPYMSSPMFWPVLKSVYGMYSVRASFDGSDAGSVADAGSDGASGGSGGESASGGAAGNAGSAGSGGEPIGQAGQTGSGGTSSGGATGGGGTWNTGGALVASGGGSPLGPAKDNSNEDESGCACRAYGPGNVGGWPLLGLSLLSLLLLRRPRINRV